MTTASATPIVLVNQPTRAPTRKMQSVGVWGVLIVPVVVGVIATVLPDLAESCVNQLGTVLTAVGLSAAQGVVTFLAGYLKHNTAEQP